MFRVFEPEWSKDGPLDAAPNRPLTSKEERSMHLIETKADSPHLYLPKIEKLHADHPDWPYAVVRLAKARLLLEDLHGALELFEKARRLIGIDTDKVFETYLNGLRTFIVKAEEEEDNEWMHPESGTIASPWRAPSAIHDYTFAEPAISAKVIEAWEALKKAAGSQVVTARYARLLAIETSELEQVFALGGDSLPRLVRLGFFSGAIDRVRPVGIQDPVRIVDILKDLQKCLNYFAGLVHNSTLLNEDAIRRMHELMIYSSRIGCAKTGDDTAYYLVLGGVYRKRLVYTYLPKETDAEDDAEDDEDRIVQYTHHARVAEEMKVFVDMMTSLPQLKSPFAIAAWVHITFAQIHPFTDGNGRIARLIASLPLIREGYPLINIRPNMRDAYLAALFQAGTARDLQPLIDVLAESMLDSIEYIRGLPLLSPDDNRYKFNLGDGDTQLSL